jgi:glycosyltransferase involved in cell wall biosynthesis
MSKFSVIIPIFNIDIIYLKQCLDSVYKQTYQDFECLLVNDCSTNLDTITFLQSVNKQYPKLDIKLINNHVNLGLGPSRNVGINNTTGQFILFLDSDDYLEIEALNLINQYLSQHSYNLDILSFSTN